VIPLYSPKPTSNNPDKEFLSDPEALCDESEIYPKTRSTFTEKYKGVRPVYTRIENILIARPI